jgi:hypothetical protein
VPHDRDNFAVVLALGIVCCLSVAGTLVCALCGTAAPESLNILASSAIGALSGFLSQKPGASAADPSSVPLPTAPHAAAAPHE